MRLILVVVAFLMVSTSAMAQTVGGFDIGTILNGLGGLLGNNNDHHYRHYPYPYPYQQYPRPYYVPEYDASVAYCMQRFKSYNPRTGFYVGYDNQLHRCP